MIIDTRTQAIAWLKFWQGAPPRGALLAVMNAAQKVGSDAAWRVLCEAWEGLYG